MMFIFREEVMWTQDVRYTSSHPQSVVSETQVQYYIFIRVTSLLRYYRMSSIFCILKSWISLTCLPMGLRQQLAGMRFQVKFSPSEVHIVDFHTYGFDKCYKVVNLSTPLVNGKSFATAIANGISK